MCPDINVGGGGKVRHNEWGNCNSSKWGKDDKLRSCKRHKREVPLTVPNVSYDNAATVKDEAQFCDDLYS